MRKNIFEQFKLKHQIDQEFSQLLHTSPSPEVLSSFIMDQYYPILMAQALIFLRKKVSDQDLEDQASELVLTTLSKELEKLQTNTFGFKGLSAYSTYLEKNMIQRFRETRRVYFPVEIQRAGAQAMELYILIHVQGLDSQQAARVLQNHLGVDSSEMPYLLQLVSKYAKSQPKTPKETYFEDELHEHSGASTKNPEQLYLESESITEVHRILNQLSPEQRHFIQQKFFDQPETTLKELGQQLNLKNPIYEMKKILSLLKRYL